MTRRRKGAPKKHGHGVLTGMRQGVKSMAKSVVPDEAAAPKAKSRWNLFWNILTGLAVVVAGAVFLQRCGVIHIKF